MAILNPKARNKVTKKSPGIPTRIANPTGRAGTKNSNGPKGGSAKSGVPANRDSNTSKKGKVPVRKPVVNNPKQIVRSSRVNHKKLGFM